MYLLSIITVTYNAEAFLRRTLKSIVSQTSQEFEYLIIDGASKDDTLKIASEYKDRINVLLSEPDRGLYDAMNKGQKLAKGKYVWFMNAGDEIAEYDTVEKLLKLLKRSPDVVFSDTQMVDNNGHIFGLRSEILPHKVPDILTWKAYKMGMLIGHQSFVARKEIAPNFILDNLSADIDWQINILKHSGEKLRYPGILSKFLTGGISSQKHFKSLVDRYKVLKKHFGLLPNLRNHLRILIRGLI